MKARILLPLAMAALLVVGCDSGPDGPAGPGFLDAVVEGPGDPPGAAVVHLSGQGITEVQGAHGVQLFHDGPRDGGDIRIVVVAIGDAPLRFRIRVEDVGGAHPEPAILELADRQNRPLSSSGGHRVRISR